MYNANILRFVSCQKGVPLPPFTVVKKVENGIVILRLIFDLRQSNTFFKDPPYTGLPNSGVFAYLDLSGLDLKKKKLVLRAPQP